MPWTTAIPVWITLAVFIPLAVALWIYRPAYKLIAYLLILVYAAASFFFVMTVNWAIVNYYLRFLSVPIVLALLIHHASSNSAGPSSRPASVEP